MSFSQNRFGALLSGDDSAEVDKLGNFKPADNDDERPAARPRRTHQPAMSPPSRRARAGPEGFDALHKEQHKPDDTERKGRDSHRHGAEPAFRGRQYDRRSGEANSFGTKKKNEQSWGHLEESQLEAATDGLSPNDPAAEGTGDLRARQQEEDDNVMTLDEYMKNRSAPKKSLPPPREANDGKEDPKWKDGVVVHRADDDDYYSGKESANKGRTRTKKEKVFIDIDPPRHQFQSYRGGRGGGGEARGRGGRGGGRGGRGRGNSRGGRGGRNENVNLADAHAFPTLG
ncbi:hypothetical protein BCR42DRAFT_446464 [Absidia repens]|uniref:Hyaluronan/mRNA-binding protein domain-containing protein n=1 Tax=Absidia repens TaxID=90262 RepID=A0A1X2IYZ3_9FUNG|nr:hypothetical protein BCR42DRAFT_446464 [Absidia repens]